MLRKFMAWRKNKSKTGEYPEFILYHLDYSKKKKDPLRRLMKFTNSEEQMWEIFDETVKSEMIGTKGDLKRGWNEYSIMDMRS